VLAQRLLTAAVGIPLLLAVLWAGHPWLGVALSVVVLLAALETGDLLERAGFPVARGLIALLAVLALALVALVPVSGDGLLTGWLVLVVALSGAAALTRAEAGAALRAWLGTAGGALLAAMPAYLLLITLSVRPDGASAPLALWLDAGRAWLLIVVFGVWSYDSAAYVTGRLWGRGRFFNHISPHKTWSGAVGGGVATFVACALLGWWVGRPLVGAGLGVLIALAAPVGDLAESALKRAAGVKESGHLFPGHGGILDRLDAFLVVAPAAWLYLALVGIA
jgi:phosphatidate cytidylyltransferase